MLAVFITLWVICFVGLACGIAYFSVIIANQYKQNHEIRQRVVEQEAAKAEQVEKEQRNEIISRKIQHKKYKPRCVFTLTTIPSRLHLLTPCVERLLSQSICPAAVVVNLPLGKSNREGCRYRVPEQLRTLALKDTRVVINRCPNDLGPATKLIPTLDLETNPNTRLFPVDDDCHFPDQYFEELLLASIDDPNTVFAYHGINFEHDGEWRFVQQYIGTVNVAETVTGVVYRRGMFSDIQVPKYGDACYLADDIWISNHITKNGYRCALLKSGADGITYRGRDGMPMYNNLDAPNPLYALNIGNNNNARCIRTLNPQIEKDDISANEDDDDDDDESRD